MSDYDAATDVRQPQITPGASVGGLVVRDPASLAPMPIQPQGMPFPGGEDPLGGGIDYRRVLHALRRTWLPALLLGAVLGSMAAVATWIFLPRGYEAVAWLRVGDRAGMLSTAGRDNAEYESYRKTQVQLIESPFVVMSALRKPGIASLDALREEEDPAGWIENALQVTAPMESQVIQVRLTAEKPEDAAMLVNAVTEAYLDDIVDKDRQDRLARRSVLEKKYKENMTEIRKRRETFNNLARQLGTVDSTEVATQRSLLLDHLGSLRARMTRWQQELSEIDAELAVMEARERGDITEDESIPEEMVQATIARDPQMLDMQQQISGLDQTIAYQAHISARGENDPAVKRLRRQRDELVERMDLRRAELRPQIVAQMTLDTTGRGGSQKFESPAVLQMRRRMIATSLEGTSEEFDKVAREVALLGQANADLEARRSEIEQLQMVTEKIGTQLESTSIDLSMPNRVTLIEQAGVPEGSDRTFRMMLSAAAGLGGLGLGVGLIVLIDYLRNRLSTPDEVPQRIGVRVLGTLPRVGRSRRRQEGLLAECIDSIRTLVVQSGRESPSVILVTSAVEQEGKTTVASQLAASLARSDKRTLLLDGDLRHPNVHLALGIELGVGLSELLRGEMTIDEAIQPTNVEGLYAVTAGECDYAAVTALSRPELPTLVKGFRESFDHVVIDAGPVLAFADALLFGQQSDFAIVTALRDVSRVPNVTAAIDRLRSVGVRVLGTVVNGVVDSRPRRLYLSPLPN
jgi:polysaccharide biosynthesis transport protein